MCVWVYVYRISAQAETLVLKEDATHQEIIEAMRHPHQGLSFLSPQTSLPGHVFVSADAVTWVRAHVMNTTSYEAAVKLLKVRVADLGCKT